MIKFNSKYKLWNNFNPGHQKCELIDGQWFPLFILMDFSKMFWQHCFAKMIKLVFYWSLFDILGMEEIYIMKNRFP